MEHIEYSQAITKTTAAEHLDAALDETNDIITRINDAFRDRGINKDLYVFVDFDYNRINYVFHVCAVSEHSGDETVLTRFKNRQIDTTHLDEYLLSIEKLITV